MTKKNYSKPLLIILTALAVVLSPYLGEAAQVDSRNLDREESVRSDTSRNLFSAGLYLPRKAIDLTMAGAAKTAGVVSDPEFIEQVEDILYIYEKKLAWFPIVSYASGFRPEYGAGLYYKDSHFKMLTTAAVHDSNYWAYKTNLSYQNYIGTTSWKVSVGGLLQEKDDYRYYGIGSDPEDDVRNSFIRLTDHDYGVFTEETRQLHWELEVKPSPNWKVSYLGLYKRRSFDPEGRGHNDLRDIFDLSSIPGFTSGSPIAQIYHELAATWDSRKQKKMLSPGARIEFHGGISQGIGENKSDFYRLGADASLFIPVIKEDRLIVPRIVLDITNGFGSDPIPFTEYSRQHTFRGISDRDLIRNDEVSLTPSLEYQWPLSSILSANVFADYLVVGKELTGLDWSEGLWASGFGIHLRYLDHELGRLELSGGSEGFQVQFSIGKPLRTNNRAKW